MRTQIVLGECCRWLYVTGMDSVELLLLDEVAVISRTSVETVRFWIRRGRLKSVKPGRRRMVTRTELERFLRGETVAGNPQPTDGGGQC
jgi:excisionase family DNA binding protein